MMKTPSKLHCHFAGRFARRSLSTASALLVPLAVLAVDPADSGNPPASPATPPPINFQILQTSSINLGNRSAIYNLVAPPVLPPPPAPAPPPPPLTAEEIQALEAQPQKKSVVLFLSATVFNRQVTQLRWSDENGLHTAFSNIDFNYFSGPSGFETTATSYFLFMGLGNQTREEAGASSVQVPPLSQFSATASQYSVVENSTNPPTAESLKALDDMHTYFDANRQQMIDSYNKRVTDQAARAQWLLDHPPVPHDTVINFWPVKSTNYPAASQGGQP